MKLKMASQPKQWFANKTLRNEVYPNISVHCISSMYRKSLVVSEDSRRPLLHFTPKMCLKADASWIVSNHFPSQVSLPFACDISPPFVAFHRHPKYRVTFPLRDVNRRVYRRASLTISKATSAKSHTYSAAPLPNPSIKIVRLESRPLNVPLIAPFKIASTTQYSVQNVAIRVQLADGSVGWGESPTLPPVTAEDQPGALAGVALAATWLLRQAPAFWQDLVRGLAKELPGHTYASVRTI